MRCHATGLLELLLVSQDSLPCLGRWQTGGSASRLLSSPAHIVSSLHQLDLLLPTPLLRVLQNLYLAMVVTMVIRRIMVKAGRC
jgi:hypothetical protein